MAKKNGSGDKKPVSPKKIAERKEKRERRKYETAVRQVFLNMGFKKATTEGITTTFDGRKCEFDDIFVFDNVVVVLELYTGGDVKTHLSPKNYIFNNINSNPSGFIEHCRESFPDFAGLLCADYKDTHYRVRIVYASRTEPPQDLIALTPGVKFFKTGTFKYFKEITRAIKKTARHEFFNFLGLVNGEIGSAVLGSDGKFTKYHGFVLPFESTNFGNGYSVVSFYADAESLMRKAFVLRRDGWVDSPDLYQRILKAEKIADMRKHLNNTGRVFVNNIIATLPSGTNIAEIQGSKGKAVFAEQARPVIVEVPDEFNSVGLIDGQHRVFCYHEGDDANEATIKSLRKQQRLLVTGVVYPEGTEEVDKRIFEAELFAEINGKQDKVTTQLLQEIEVLIRPWSVVAVSKRIIHRLNSSGVYNGLFQAGLLDEPYKIKTASIVSFGLRPLVKFSGNDSLYAIWVHEKKETLVTHDADAATIDAYVEFCTSKLNELFLAAKLASPGVWDLNAPYETRSPLLNPTAIVGFIVCLRKLIEAKQPIGKDKYEKGFAGLKTFPFGDFKKSSLWQQLGKSLFETLFK